MVSHCASRPLSRAAPDDRRAQLLPGMVRATLKRVAGQGAGRPGPARRPRPEPAAVDPVARVLVDVPLAHLDRPFDYAVPATMADAAVPGSRVKVRFAGQDVDGFVVGPGRRADHTGPARRRCAGWSAPSRCWRPQVAAPVRRARRAVRRHAAPTCSGSPSRPGTRPTEKEPSPPAEPGSPRRRRRRGRLGRPRRRARPSCGTSPTAAPRGRSGRRRPADRLAGAWSRTPPPRRWPRGRGALLCVPDGKDVARVDRAL